MKAPHRHAHNFHVAPLLPSHEAIPMTPALHGLKGIWYDHRGHVRTPGRLPLSFQLVSPSDLNDRSKTMIEFEAEYDGKPLICSISRRVLEQLGKRQVVNTDELLAVFEEHRPVIAAMVRRK